MEHEGQCEIKALGPRGHVGFNGLRVRQTQYGTLCPEHRGNRVITGGHGLGFRKGEGWRGGGNPGQQ